MFSEQCASTCVHPGQRTIIRCLIVIYGGASTISFVIDIGVFVRTLGSSFEENPVINWPTEKVSRTVPMSLGSVSTIFQVLILQVKCPTATGHFRWKYYMLFINKCA